MKQLFSLAPALVLSFLPFVTVQACGPEFFLDVFVHDLHPDHPADYATGKLGVLLPTYPRADLAVAYRYLNGGTLTAEEQKGYQPTFSFAEQAAIDDAAYAQRAQVQARGTSHYPEQPGPADQWLEARSHYAPPQPEIHPVHEFAVIYRAGLVLAGSYENCQADAFRTAVVTLESRARTWGAKSAELADWINGQDAVFSNCESSGSNVYGYFTPQNRPVIHQMSPAVAPHGAPVLLREDRAYQIAAAQFYAGQFEAARASFQAIMQDNDSPWRGIAPYLMARSLIREAYLTTKTIQDDSTANFNLGLMKQAQQQLQSMQGEHLPGMSPQAVQDMLHLIRLRTEPDARLREISVALAGPKSDPNYKQDLKDLAWYLNGKLDSLPVRQDAADFNFQDKRPQNDYTSLTPAQKQPGFEKAYRDLADMRTISPLIDWLITFQSPAESARKHAISEWERTKSTPWLVVAIMKTAAADTVAPTLMTAAARVSPASPAWITITYHRLRLLIDSCRVTEARNELVAVLPKIQASGSDSTINLFTSLRMHSAATLDSALASAPRKIIERTSEEQSALGECLYVMKNPKRKYDCKQDANPLEFSEDAAMVFNNDMPLAKLAQTAQSSALPPQLRQSVAMMTWVRAVLLKNNVIAAQMFPLLPQKLQLQAGSGGHFQALMAILRNPGLRPYLDGGVQRSASYDFVESYSDNWWCADWAAVRGGNTDAFQTQSVAFLSPQERETGEKETAALLALGSAEEFLGAQAVDYARTHPSDPNVPESLFLTLRMIRYGCYHGWGEDYAPNKQHTSHIASIAYEIGAIMRRRYPANPWTKRAAPFVWLVKKDD